MLLEKVRRAEIVDMIFRYLGHLQMHDVVVYFN